MPISKKQDYIRDIFMMVRRESVMFEPQDRVKLSVQAKTKDGEPLSYYVGSVYYDFDSGKMCYSMFTQDNRLIVPDRGARNLEDNLTASELKLVSDKVSEYTQKSIYRARNMGLISEALETSDNETIVFDRNCLPDVCVDRHRTGDFEPSCVFGLFRQGGGDSSTSMFLSVGSFASGDTFSYPLYDLSDIGVSTVLSSIEMQLGKKLSRNEKVDSKQAKTLSNNLSM